MKSKSKQFLQFLTHDIEDEDLADEYLEQSLPLVGRVVMYFNAMEKSIDSFLCEVISDRTDEPGLIVLQRLMCAAKIDLFKRFSDDFHRIYGSTWDKYPELLNELGEVNRLRNMVVHADWSSTDHEGYTFVRLKVSERGFMQEYVQFSVDSLEALIERIIATDHLLSDYWIWRSDFMQSYLHRAT